jgi:hypothetical protein
MPLNLLALYPQITKLAEAEAAQRRCLAEQASVVADEVAARWLAQGEARTFAAQDQHNVLKALNTTIHAWNAVLECYAEASPEYQAGSQKQQRLQQTLLTLLRQEAPATEH